MCQVDNKRQPGVVQSPEVKMEPESEGEAECDSTVPAIGVKMEPESEGEAECDSTVPAVEVKIEDVEELNVEPESILAECSELAFRQKKPKSLRKQRKKKPLNCENCGKSYQKRRPLLEHMKSCDKVPETCEVCNKSFKNLKVHMKSCQKVPETCEVCNKSFKNLKDHMTTHSDDYPFKCSVCGKGFRKKWPMKEHERAHSVKLECHICGSRYTKSRTLRVHLKTHAGQGLTTCEVCKMQMLKSSLRNHMQTHEVRMCVECKMCNKMFLTESGLKKHTNESHSDMKPFACDQCDYKTKREGSLREHKKRHTGEMPYSCNDCEERFRIPQGLKKHYTTWHSGLNKCEICSRCFETDELLVSHKEKNKGQCFLRNVPAAFKKPRPPKPPKERKFSCDQCSYIAYHITQLQYHQRIHTGEKPYKCSECGENFRGKAALRRHQKIWHSGTNKCLTCYRCFQTEEILTEHLAEKKGSCFGRGAISRTMRKYVAEQKKDAMNNMEDTHFLCKSCNESFPDCEALFEHERSHHSKDTSAMSSRYFPIMGAQTKPQCKLCPEILTQREHLKIHVRTHDAVCQVKKINMPTFIGSTQEEPKDTINQITKSAETKSNESEHSTSVWSSDFHLNIEQGLASCFHCMEEVTFDYKSVNSELENHLKFDCDTQDFQL